LSNLGNVAKRVRLSAHTDGYQSIAKRLQTTREVINVLAERQYNGRSDRPGGRRRPLTAPSSDRRSPDGPVDGFVAAETAPAFKTGTPQQ
jgi:hypothetical protein